MDDGLGGRFVSKEGYTTPYMTLWYESSDVVKGRYYRFRYRAQNCQGWSSFSDELYVIAAESPLQPEPIQLVSTSSTQVQLQLFPSIDNMGSVVTDYTLYRNQGNDDSNWTKINGYSFVVDGYFTTVDVASETITAGKYYQFVYKATNMLGDSPLSKTFRCQWQMCQPSHLNL
jgi:hypothetical protein